MKTKTIKVDYLARVEGEGAFHLTIKDNKIKEAHLKIFEPPRFFEAFLQGRDFREAPDITARICGICPVAYMMSSVHAMENALGIDIPHHIGELRRLLYCGEWIESHMLHMIMLHAPDFLGFAGAIEMAKVHQSWLQKGLSIKKTGNDIVALLGGREIHPINVKVGGFYKIPSQSDLRQLKEKLLKAKDDLMEVMKWLSGFDFPELEKDYLFVSTSHDDEYPFNRGDIVTGRGDTIRLDEYEDYFFEEHVSYTNALQSHFGNKEPYLVGPLARFFLCYDRLTPSCRQLAEELDLAPRCINPFKSLLIRGIEVLYALEEGARVIDGMEGASRVPFVEVEKIRAAVGYGCTEAPRGTLWHRYEIDDAGLIQKAKIVPPTSQNQMMIEQDLKDFAGKNLKMKEEELKWHLEQTIRNYDPCISCATHFLKLKVRHL